MITIVAGLIACSATYAQSRKQEISIVLGGGLSTLQYEANVGERNNAFGGLFGLNYSYYLSSDWSLLSGVEVGLYNAEMKIDKINDFTLTTSEGYDMEYRNRVSNLDEKQQLLHLNIPLMAQYAYAIGNERSVYVAGGFKVGIPVSKKFKIETMDLYNRGFFPQINEEGHEVDAPQFMGFGNFSVNDYKGDLKTKVSVSLALEAGMRWPVGETMALYTGAYFEYGLNNIRKVEQSHLIGYNADSPEDFVHASALSSEYSIRTQSDNVENHLLAGDARVLAAGVKLRLAFNL